MIKLINNIIQIITVLGCSIILTFTVIMLIEFTKDEYTSITDIYTYTYVLTLLVKMQCAGLIALLILMLCAFNNVE